MPRRDETDHSQSADHQPGAGQNVTQNHQHEEGHRRNETKHCRFFASQLGEACHISSEYVLERLSVFEADVARTEDGAQPRHQAEDEQDSIRPNVQPRTNEEFKVKITVVYKLVTINLTLWNLVINLVVFAKLNLFVLVLCEIELML